MVVLSNKTIWLVGASSGIGLELARQLAAAKNFVFVTARSIDKLDALRREFPQRVACIPGDITDQDSVASIERMLGDQTDTLDMVILCAGVCEYDDGPSLLTSMYRRVFDVNFFAAVACSNIALPFLKKSRGMIVGMSSMAAVVPFPRAEAYGASKVALEYFLESLKIDLVGSGVDVKIVRPGFVKTPLTDRNDFSMPFILDAQTAAKKIISGLAGRQRIISFPWQMKNILGFFSCFKSFWLATIAKQFRKTEPF